MEEEVNMGSDSTAPASHNTGIVADPSHAALSPKPYVHVYAQVLQGLDNPFAQHLKSMHGLSDAIQTGAALGIGSYSHTATPGTTHTYTAGNVNQLHFRDEWGSALAYRYRPIEEVTAEARNDHTIREVIMGAEQYIQQLYDAITNVQNCTDKPNSIELKSFQPLNLDTKAVEACCRCIMTALIHRCVVGFCSPQHKANGDSKEDKALNCKDRLVSVVQALKHNKRICRDVMAEDSKVTHLVHSPIHIVKSKDNQQKGNDAKRKLISDAKAARSKKPFNMVPPSSSPDAGDSQTSTFRAPSTEVSHSAPIPTSTASVETTTTNENSLKEQVHIKKEEEDEDIVWIQSKRVMRP